MDHGPRISSKLIALLITAIFLAPVLSSPLYAKTKPNRHLLSWESLRSKDKSMKWEQLKRSERRVDVKKYKVIRLKKSSFWNKRPFQFSTPVVFDSMVYVGVDAGYFYGIDTRLLKKDWYYKTEGPVQAAAIIEGGNVYFGDADGHAYALSKENGMEIWKIRLGSPIFSKPLIAGNVIYFTTESSQLFALNLDSGNIIWSTDEFPKSVGFSIRRGSSPALIDNRIIFGNSQGTLLAYTTSGNIAWARQLGGKQALVYDLDSHPLSQGGCVYVATADQNVFCVSPSDGHVIWNIPDLGGANDLLLKGNSLYVSGQGVISKVDATTGNLIWEQDLETAGISSPAVSDDIIAVISTEDKFYLIDPETGDIIFDRYVRKGSFGDPVFSGDHLFILSNTGRFYTFKIKEKTPKVTKKD